MVSSAPRIDMRKVVIESRRTLLRQAAWFYWLTLAVGVMALVYYFAARRRGTVFFYLFSVMAGLCVVLPVLSRLAERYPGWKAWLFPRKLKTTREGRWYILLVILIGFAAVNTGDNLLYLILAMMLSFIVSSGILSESVLKRLHFRRVLPDGVFAGEEFVAKIEIRNDKRKITSYSIITEDPDMEVLSDLSTAAYCFCVPPGETAAITYHARARKRGVYLLSRIEVATKFPYNFFFKSMERNVPEELTVYPLALEMDPGWMRDVTSRLEATDRSVDRSGGQNHFHSLRDYLHGDNPRRIHWRSSARQGKLVVKEYEDVENSRVLIVVDNHVPAGADPADYETLLSFVTGAALFFARANFSVDLFYDGTMKRPVSLRGGIRGIHPFMRTLAGLQPSKVPQAPKILEAMQKDSLRGAHLLVVSLSAHSRMVEAVRRLAVRRGTSVTIVSGEKLKSLAPATAGS